MMAITKGSTKLEPKSSRLVSDSVVMESLVSWLKCDNSPMGIAVICLYGGLLGIEFSGAIS